MTTSALTNFSEDALLDHVLGTTAMTMPAGTFLKAHIGDPGEDAANNAAAFTTRTEITDWDAPASFATANTNELAIPGLTASETISWWSVWSAATAGNPLFYGQLATPRAVEPGDTLRFGAGDIDLDFLSTNLSTYAAHALLRHLVGKTAFTMPTGTFVGLHVGAPGNDGTANVADLSTRTASGAWSNASGGASDNDALISFTGTADETVSHLTIFDALAAGNCLWQGPLTASKLLAASVAVECGAGALAVSLS